MEKNELAPVDARSISDWGDETWIVGLGTMAKMTGLSPARMGQLVRAGDIQGATYVGMPGFGSSWAIRIGDLMAWKEQREAAYEASHKPEPLELVAPQNGHSDHAAAMAPIILKEGSPLLTTEEARKIALALWDLKTVIEKQMKVIEANTEALNKVATAFK